jgi:hypothetical protein
MIRLTVVVLALLLAAVPALVSCGHPPVQLRYADGRIVECGGQSWGMADSGLAAVAQAREAQCIQDHRAQGAVRL